MICYLKGKDDEIASKTLIPKSGYVSLRINKIFYSENMIEFNEDELLFELIKYKWYCTVMLQNHLEHIKNKWIFESTLFKGLPGIVVGKRNWQLFIGDVLRCQDETFLVGGLSFHKSLDIIRHSELETSSQLTVFHK